MKKNGYSIIELKTIFINQKLKEEQVKKVLLHELSHLNLHAEYLALYDKGVHHSKMESEANVDAISYIIAENDGYYNFSGLLEEFDIGMGYDVRFAQ